LFDSLDSIGIAGFSHDFRYLDGQRSPATAAFEELLITEMSFLAQAVSIFSFTFPFIQNVPTHRMRLFQELRRSLSVITERLLADTCGAREGSVADEQTDKSVIGLLRTGFCHIDYRFSFSRPTQSRQRLPMLNHIWHGKKWLLRFAFGIYFH
jgi:hypothetical protein